MTHDYGHWAVAFWVALYVSVAFLIFGYRWVALVWRMVRHRARIAEVLPEGPGVVSLLVTGRHLDRLPSEAGQFFMLRILRRGSWWKAHPFSVSAPPDGTFLRFTIKALGDDTTALQTIELGTRVALEGPYGGFLDVLPTERPMLFIAGGIGITPFRGLIEDLDRPEDVTLVYRNRTPADAVFRRDLERLSQEFGFSLHFSYSRHGEERDPFSPASLARVAPRLRDSDVFVIGSPPLVAAARRGLRLAGVPARRIHLESFSY